MKNFLKINIIIYYILLSINALSQDKYLSPMQDFQRITSNFGDIRSSSFHFGIDYSTDGKKGIPVRAIKKGYLARIKVEPGGYGRVLYINHYDSTTSVYAHLDSFISKITEYVINEQYKRKSYKVDLIIDDKKFFFNEGDIIGFSGNSGQSSGPHLHFELRKTKTQNPINAFIPLINIKDEICPHLNKIYFYNSIKYIDGKNDFCFNILNTKNNSKNNLIINVPNNFCIGVEAYDYISDTSRKLGIYSVQLLLDDSLIFEYTCDELNFEQMKNSKGIIDYLNRNINNSTILYLFRLPNVELIPIKTAKNNGIITINDSLIHKMKIILSDVSGNTKNFRFQVKNNYNKKVQEKVIDCPNIISWNKENVLVKEGIKIIFSKNSLFNDICIDNPVINNINSLKVINIGNENIPLKNNIQICFPDSIIKEKYISKSLIVRLENNKKISCGGEIKDKYIIGKSMVFGSFTIAIDTTSPTLIPINFVKEEEIANINEIIIKIKDDLSGINEYNGYIDDNWVLFEYDEKSNLIKYTFDYKRFKANNEYHILSIEVSDKKGNLTVKKYKFIK